MCFWQRSEAGRCACPHCLGIGSATQIGLSAHSKASSCACELQTADLDRLNDLNRPVGELVEPRLVSLPNHLGGRFDKFSGQ